MGNITAYKTIIFSLLAAMTLLTHAGCSAARPTSITPTATPAPSETPTPAVTPTPFIRPTRPPIKVVRLELVLTGGRFPFKDQIRRVFKYARLGVSEAPSQDPYATLRIECEGEALGANYVGIVSGYLYTGARVEGVIAYNKVGETIIKKEFSDDYGPTPLVKIGVEGDFSSEPTTPEDAPYERIPPVTLLRALFEILAQTEGADPLVAALQDENEKIAYAAAYVLAEQGDPQGVEFLLNKLKIAETRDRSSTVWQLNQLLNELTGETFEKYDDWERWWKANKPTFSTPAP